MKRVILAATAAAVAMSSSANAETRLLFKAREQQGATVRYDRGKVTVDEEKQYGAVQVTPLGLDHGSLTFSVAVYNGSDRSANFDVDNIAGRAGDQSLRVFSEHELEKKAKNRAMWTQIGLAALGGVAAAAAASQQDRYTATTYTRHGTYRTTITTPSAAGQVEAAAISAGTAVGIARVQDQLDATRDALGADIVQVTTIDPQDSYGGRIVFEKIKKGGYPQEVQLTVNWNGESYPFSFLVTKQ